jgi:N-acetylneuraminic acid mutarotase
MNIDKLNTQAIINDIEAGIVNIPVTVNNNPVADKDAATLNYLTQKTTQYLSKANPVMTGPLQLSYTPTDDNHIVNMKYVLDASAQRTNSSQVYFSNKIQNYLPKSGGTITGDLVLSGNPTNDFDLATYGYLKNKIASITGGGTVTDGIKTGTIVEVPYNYTYNNSAYLLCNGASVSKSTYSDLYKIIGDTFAPPGPGAGIPWQSQCGFNSSTQSDITNWASANSLATPTSQAASLVTKNYIYILGGYDANQSSYLDAIQRASFDNDGNLTSTWSNAGTLPDGGYGMGYVATKDRFYLIGGIYNHANAETVYSAPINADGTLGTFRTETSLPKSTYNAVCFVIKNKLYVVGGSGSDAVNRTTVNNDGTLSNWETLSNFPIELEAGNPKIIKDRIYIFEACDKNHNSKTYYATYDSDGNIGSWTYVSDMPNNIVNSAIVCTDNYVFSIGGYDEKNSTYTNASYCAPISSDGSVGNWTAITKYSVSTGYGQIAIAGNKIYFIGGNTGGGAIGDVYSATFTSGITDYTPYYTDQLNTSSTPVKESAGIPWQSQSGFNQSTQSDITGWTSTNSLMTAAYYAASLVTKNYIYILGGYNANSYLNTIQRASFDSDGNLTSSWSNAGTLPVAMTEMGYVATKGRFYLIGGENGSGHLSTVYSAPINNDGTLGDFRKESSLPDTRIDSVCFVIKNKLYVVGGGNSANFTNTVYQATINTDGTLSSWTTLPNFPINSHNGKPLIIKDRIYIFGATNDNGVSNIYYATYDSNGNIDSWSNGPVIPDNINNSAIVCTDNYVFTVSGYNEKNNTYTNVAYRAPISSDGSIGDWTQISNGPVAAGFGQSVIAGNKIYFIGGYYSDTDNNDRHYLDTVYSANFTSGITDYTPYYTDQSNTSSTFKLPDLTSRSNTSPRMKYIIKT